MAPRPLASATISFGLVSIPVKLFTSTRASESISFRMIHEKCGSPLKYQYWCPKDEKTVERDDIVKGYEYAKDRYVLMTPEELKGLEEATKAIAIEEFVALDKIDPVYFEKAYYLGPEKGGERAYKLLSQAMSKKGLAGLARYAARGKQYLVMVRPVENGLVMQQLHYANEVRSISEVDLPSTKVKDAELKLAMQLIEQSISDTFEPEKYEDEVRSRVLEVIQQKVDGEEVTFAPSDDKGGRVGRNIHGVHVPRCLAGGAAEKPKSRAKRSAARKPAKASPRKAARKTRKKASK